MTGHHAGTQHQQRNASPLADHEQHSGEEQKRARTGMSVSDLLSTSSRRDTARSSLSDGPSNDAHSPHTDDGRASSRMTISRASSSAALTRGDAIPTRAATPSGSEQQTSEGVTAYQYAAVQQITEGRDNIEYILTIREQPKHSRMCGVGEKADRRPIDPAPIIQLRIVTHEHPNPASASKTEQGEDANRPLSAPKAPLGESRSNIINAAPPADGGAVGRRNPNARRGIPVLTEWGEGWEDKTWYLENPYYFMYAMLADAETDEELHLLSDGKTRYTTGSCVSCLYHLKDIDGTEQGFFVFPDLSIRVEGRYRLKLCLFETLGHEVHHCKSVYSKPFNVYTAKRFPGMEESTLLSKSFADQGLKVRVRKNPRARRTRGNVGKRKDAMDSDEDSDGGGGGAYRDQTAMMLDSTASGMAGNKRVKGDVAPMYVEHMSAAHGAQRRAGGGGDFAYDAYATAPPPPSRPQLPSPQYGHAPAGRHTQSYSPEERREGSMMDYYNSRPIQARLDDRPAPPMEHGHPHMSTQHHARHGQPPPPPQSSGYMDAAGMDARRAMLGYRHAANEDPVHFQQHQRLPQGRPPPPPMMHSEQHAANVAAEREAFNRERDREAAMYQEQQQTMRERQRRSTIPVGPLPPAPSHYGEAQQRGGAGGGGGVNAYDPRFGSAPLPGASSLAVPTASSRDRSISDPYLTRDGHRMTSNGAGDMRDGGMFVADQQDARRHRLPPLHVALSPDSSPRMQRGPAPSGVPSSRPRSAQQPGAAMKGGYGGGPENVTSPQHNMPPHADRRYTQPPPQQQQGQYYGGGYQSPAEQMGGGGGAPAMHNGGGRGTTSFPPPQYFGDPTGGLARMPPPPSYHNGARSTQYGGAGR